MCNTPPNQVHFSREGQVVYDAIVALRLDQKRGWFTVAERNMINGWVNRRVPSRSHIFVINGLDDLVAQGILVRNGRQYGLALKA